MNALPLALILAAAPEHSGTTIGVSLLVLGVAAIAYCLKHKGSQWWFGVICVVFGVVGAGTFVGSLSWGLVDIVTKGLDAVGSAITNKANGG